MNSLDCFKEFESYGLNPKSSKIIVLKHPFPHYPGYPMGLMVQTPGAIPIDFKNSPYKELKRPIWPYDADPFGSGDI